MKLSKVAQRMVQTILILSVIVLLISLLFRSYIEFVPLLLGLTLGSGTSILKVILLDKAVDKSLTMDKKKATNYVSLQHMLRLFLTAVVLFVGAVVDGINLWGVVIGVLAYQLAAYSTKSL